jgi:hypothetical protein
VPLLRLLGYMFTCMLTLYCPFGKCARSDVSVRADSEVYREFIDPCLGSRWQLQIDPAHPDRPGRLILISSGDVRQSARGDESASEMFRLDETVNPSWESRSHIPNLTLPVAIRAGEHLIVEQDSRILRARFQAIALESARVGQRMRVRLSAGATMPVSMTGAVISVIATGAGRAMWLSEEEVKP